MNITQQEILARVDVDPATECWNWTGGLGAGGRGSISRDGVTNYAYRVAYELWVGPIPRGLFACHHCDNPRCVNPEHIFLGTAADNAHDAMNKGRFKLPPKRRGSDVHNATTPDAVIAEAVRLYVETGVSQAEIARRVGVAQSTVGRWIRAEARRVDGGIQTGRGKRPEPALARCGTRAGYYRHKRQGDAVCESCRVANADYMRDYKRKQRARDAA